jgi:chromosome segregation ATPase
MKKIIITVMFLLASSSCAGVPGEPGLQFSSAPRDKIEAENRLMRNNLSLAMRENEVLKEENLRYKSEVTQLSDCVARLTSELSDTDSRHQKRAAELEALLERLHLRQMEVETEFYWTVDELRVANAVMEEITAARLEEMAAHLKNTEEDFQKALVAAKNELSERMEKFVRETENLGQMLDETRTALKELEGRMEHLSRTDDDMRSELEAVRRAMEEIGRKTIDLDQALESLKTAGRTPAGPEPGPDAGETQEDM